MNSTGARLELKAQGYSLVMVQLMFPGTHLEPRGVFKGLTQKYTTIPVRTDCARGATSTPRDRQDRTRFARMYAGRTASAHMYSLQSTTAYIYE